MKDAWAAFRFATNDKTNAEREGKWFEIIRAVAPGKMLRDIRRLPREYRVAQK